MALRLQRNRSAPTLADTANSPRQAAAAASAASAAPAAAAAASRRLPLRGLQMRQRLRLPLRRLRLRRLRLRRLRLLLVVGSLPYLLELARSDYVANARPWPG